MRRGGEALLLVAAAVAACDRPEPLVICHNANCVGAVDPDDDDDPEVLRASLALRHDGRPAIDGVELDTLWHRPSGACLFEHGPGETLPPDTVAEAIAIVAAHLAQDDVAWNGERFHVFLELKPYVAARWDAHTDAEVAAHVACVLDAYDQLVAAAAGRHRLRIVFESSARLLAALVAHPRWPGRRDGDVEVRLAVEAELLVGADFPAPEVAVDILEYVPGALTDAQHAAFVARDLELSAWMYVATPETLATIARHRPRYVVTGEALLLRRWIAR